MMAKPMKTLEMHFPMIQFLIILDIEHHDTENKVQKNKNGKTKLAYRIIPVCSFSVWKSLRP